MAVNLRERTRERDLRQREVLALERQAYAWARIATALEKRNAMEEQRAAPLRVHVDGRAKMAPQVVTTPAPEIPKLEERDRPDPEGLDDDEVEPLSDHD